MIYLITNQTNIHTGYEVKRGTLEQMKKRFEGYEYLGVDTETGGFNPYFDPLLMLQIGDYTDQFVIDCTTVDVRELKEFFEKSGTVFIFHNAKFDLRFLYHKGIYPRYVADTYLQERLLSNGYPQVRLSLDACVQRYEKVYLDKQVRGVIHREGLSNRVIKYAADDVKYLIPLNERQRVRLKSHGMVKVTTLENKFVRVLAYMEMCGFKLDVDKWKLKMAQDRKKMLDARSRLNSYVIESGHNRFIKSQLDLFSTQRECLINWASPKQVVEYFQFLGIDTLNKQDNKHSVDAKILEPQKDRFPILDIYLSYKEAEKVVGTYGQSWLDRVNKHTGRVHTSFTQIMNTGRISSGGKDRATGQEDPNFQNIPSDPLTRSCFTAGPDNTLIICDYSGQEQVILANKSMDPALLEFYDSGEEDMHSFVCKQIAKVSNLFPKEIATMTLDEIKSKHKNSRQAAKGAGFAINYGGNGYTISKNLNITPAEGDKVYEAYFQAFPQLRNYFDAVQQVAWHTGIIIYNSVTGRRFFIDRHDDFYATLELEAKVGIPPSLRKEFMKKKGSIGRMALNYPIQGTGADMTKLALIGFFQWIEDNDYLWKVRIPNAVHDEIVAECPVEMADKVAEVVQDCMVRAAAPFCKRIPMKAEPEISFFWKK